MGCAAATATATPWAQCRAKCCGEYYCSVRAQCVGHVRNLARVAQFGLVRANTANGSFAQIGGAHSYVCAVLVSTVPE